jgi:U1 small nuclear ribonucleoprotein
MTSLLPPNLLRLFAPRAQPQFLKPLTKDEQNRGPDRLQGCGQLVKRIREEAEEAEYREGLADAPSKTATTVEETNGDAVKDVKAEKMEVDEKEEGEEVDNLLGEVKKDTKGKSKSKARAVKPARKDKISEMGIVGQEAVKMRRELRKKRQEEYKKSLEKNCECAGYQSGSY